MGQIELFKSTQKMSNYDSPEFRIGLLKEEIRRQRETIAIYQRSTIDQGRALVFARERLASDPDALNTLDNLQWPL